LAEHHSEANLTAVWITETICLPGKDVRKQKLKRDVGVDLAIQFCWPSPAATCEEVGDVSGSELTGQH
jgi:hypothetical protein